MNGKLSIAVIVTALVISLIGLLNVVLGIISVISGALPSAEGRLIAPPIAVGSIIFGLMMLVVGALWVTSGVGYFTLKEWATTLALYVAPAIVGINIAGVINLWGFSVNIGWAALNTVAGIGSIWYLSRKELASFFLFSVAEHVIVLAIFAILIYGEPVDKAESADDAMIVSIEAIEQKDPLLAEIIPQERTAMEKPPALPKIQIQDLTATDPGTEIEDSVPQMPRTFTETISPGEDMVLRPPTPRERGQRYDGTTPVLDLESALDSSKKPSLDIGPSERVKDSSETTVAREPRYVQNDILSPDERVGPSDEVAKPDFAGEISGQIAGRKVVFWPKQPGTYKGTEGGSATLKFWVDPAGSVSKVEISKKSGNPRLDTIAKEYILQVRFEELPENVQQKIQWGEMSIDFELTRKTG